MLKVQVTDDPASIEAARVTAAAAERATIEGVFERLRAFDVADHSNPQHLRYGVDTTSAERALLQRRRDETVPRLDAIAAGRSGEDEWTRLFAAEVLSHVDPPGGFRAFLPLLTGDDTEFLATALSRMDIWCIPSSFGDGEIASYRLDEAQAGRLFALLDHPDRRIAARAASILGDLMPAGSIEQLQRRIDHPVVGSSARLALSGASGRAELLDHAITALSSPNATWDTDLFDVIERYTSRSPHPELVARASSAIVQLKDSPRVPPEARRRVDDALIGIHRREEARANWPADCQRATAIIQQVAAAELLDAAEVAEAIGGLHKLTCPELPREPDWGVHYAFGSASRRVMFDTESCDVPPPHDELVRVLAEASRGAFAPEAVFQLRGAGKGEYPVQFVHRRKLYRMMIEYCGDWYQTDHVVAAVNAALEDDGEPRRFVSIDTGDQMAELFFAHPDRLREIAPESGLELREAPQVIVGDVASLARACVLELLHEADPHATLPELARVADPWGNTALYYAAGEGRGDVVEALIAAGADPGLACGDGKTALHRAAEEGHVGVIATLIAAGAPVQAAADYGATPLHLAAEEGHIEAIAALVAAGADPNALDSDGSTPLHRAASDDQAEAISVLLEKAAILRARDRRGFTPLHTAANDGAPAAAALLIDRGIPVDDRTREMSPSPEAPEVKGLPLGEMLAWAGWHIGGKVEAEQTPLHRAAFRGKRAVVELLLDRGADVNAADALLQTPLHLAIAQNETKAAELLLARGGDPERRDSQGRTPDERAGDREAKAREVQRGLRRLLWVLRIAQVLIFPVRLAGWAVRLIRKIWPVKESS